MTVDADFVEDLSGYLEGSDFTAAQFSRYLGWAQAQIAKDAPALSGVALDEATALLIAHYIARRLSSAGEYSSEKSGDWQGTRATGAGSSSWLLEYQRRIAEEAETAAADGVQPAAGIERADRRTSAAFALSDQPLPSMRYEDSGRGLPG
jgi:hypothetical protein